MLLMTDFLLHDAAFIATTLLSTSAARTSSKRIISTAMLFPPVEGTSFFFFSSSSSSSSSSVPCLTRFRSRSSVDTALSATWQLGFILGLPSEPGGAGAAVYHCADAKSHAGAGS
jgi:hypothetical protein